MKNISFYIILLFCLSCKKNDEIYDDNKIIMIPDEFFERSLSKYDSDKQINGQILYSDIKNIDTLKFVNSGQAPLTLSGIEYFTNLKFLQVYTVRMTTLDLSHNTSIRYLDCSGDNVPAVGGILRSLKVLNLGNNKVIETLITNYTYLKSFSIKEYPTIKNKSCIECL